jgi:hypothetical protein
MRGLLQNWQNQLTNGPLIKKQVMIFDNSRLKIVYELLKVLSDVVVVVCISLLKLLNLGRDHVFFVFVVLDDGLL